MESPARVIQQLISWNEKMAWPFVLASLTASLAIILYAIPRGIDITDESLYVLMSQPDPDIKLSVIHTQLIFQWIHGVSGWSPGYQSLRWIRLLLTLFSFAFLGNTAARGQKNSSKSLFTIGSMALGLFLFSGNGRIFSLGYNAMNWTWGILILTTTIAWIRDQRSWPPITIGILLYLAWITKFPSAVILTGITLLILPFLSRMNKKSWAFGLFISTGTLALLIAISSTTGHSISPLSLWTSTQAETSGSHQADSLLKHSFFEVIKYYGMLLPSLLFGWWTKPKQETLDTSWISPLLAMGIVALAVADLMTLRQFNSGYWFLAGSLACWQCVQSDNRKNTMIAAGILLTPVALTLGTDVGWEGHMLPLTGLPIIAALLVGAPRSLWVAAVAVPLVMLPELVLHPYRQAPLAQCTESITLQRTKETITVSPTVTEYLRRSHELISKYNHPLLGTDRNFAETLLSSSPIEGEILWSTESWNVRHSQAWQQHDTLLLALCNSNDKPFYQRQLSGYNWQFVGKVDRRSILKEQGRFGWGIPDQNMYVSYHILTKQ